MTLHSEILEQPARLENLFSSQRKTVEEIAKAIHSRDIQFVFLAARGTSDNAGRYANYLWGAQNSLPMALATPSLFTYYQQPPKIKNALIVGISQSGQSPDIVSVLAEGKKQGNLTLAITNEPNSPLAKNADFILDIQAGEEKAVAATKTYTSQLMSIAMLSAAMSGRASRWGELEQVSGWVQDALVQDQKIAQAAQRYRYMQQSVVLGRGYNYATAFEWALKLKELTYVAAEPYSSADFKHGPVAMVESGFPIFAISPNGKVFDSMLEMLKHLKNDLRAELVIISNNQKALEMAQVPISIPVDTPEWLSPLISIIPAQLFAYYLTLAKGYDPEKPRTIQKVTETR
ncbi:MAG: SIS domain-containing protein [Anaerolineae bacterium]|jgi:glutamine---fructose-6-phosphate transaminase (isomerizing)|nr:SIS domain-containing protein [Anaerolineae bacterium]MBT7074192.1 SIS domain-containing protein [Anaerolineae bacterium]MBT7990239.1 SIS domain-containing protein [Anaerolineae bacterium]